MGRVGGVMGLRCLILTILVPICTVVQAEQKFFYVMTVYCGDRIRVVDMDSNQFDVRLRGIDAPEKDQPFGEESTKTLMRWVQNKFVHLEEVKFFKDGNAVATVFVHERHGNRNVNEDMVEWGMAWDVSKDGRYASVQREAKVKHYALWSSFPQIEPSEWRKKHPCESVSIDLNEAKKLIPKQYRWRCFLEQEAEKDREAKELDKKKNELKREAEEFDRKRDAFEKVERGLRELPSRAFDGWGDLSVNSLFGVKLGLELKDVPFQTKRLEYKANVSGYGGSFNAVHEFTPKKPFRNFRDYRLCLHNEKIVSVCAEMVVEDGAQFSEDVLTLKMILERRFGVEFQKVQDHKWYVFVGSGRDYTMIRIGERSVRGHRVLMVELKVDGERFNRETLERHKEHEAEMRKYEGIDAL